MDVRDPNGPIQVTPVGLLGMLSLKTGGMMPDAMRQDVQPTVDLEAYWLRSTRVVDRVNRGITLPAAVYNNYQDFSPNTIIVPQQEWWYVHSYSVRVYVENAADTANAVRLALLFNSTGTLRYRFIGEVPPFVIHTAATPMLLLLAEGFWAPPGSHIGFFCYSVAGPVGLTVDVVGLDYSVLPL